MKGQQKHIGFSGSREGMTDYQKERILRILYRMVDPNNPVVLHHGCCVGADEEMHHMWLEFDLDAFPNGIYLHPPKNKDLVFDFEHSLLRSSNYNIADGLDYLERDRAIVDETDLLIATPKLMDENSKSGTWYTIRYAKKTNKPVLVIPPNS